MARIDRLGVLRAAINAGPTTPKEIAALLDARVPSVRIHLAGLVAEGWATREPAPAPADQPWRKPGWIYRARVAWVEEG